jgi:cytochrome c556
MKKFVSALAAATVVLGASPAMAQFAKAEDAVKYRQSAFFIMAQNFGRVAAMAQGKAPFDARVAAESAAIAETMSKLPWAGFVPGSESAGTSKAKPDIWTDTAKFKEGADKMQSEMTKFSAAAKTGSLDNIKAALPAVGGTCKACHDDFRAK